MQPDLSKMKIYYMKQDNFEAMKGLPALPLFSDAICEFLHALSVAIRNDKQAKEYPDVMTFGFFCRKSNLMQLKQQFFSNNRLGRGLSFHVAPSNVPINFAYSFVVGLLAGNPCVVRTSSKDFAQTSIICRLIEEIASKHPVSEYLAVVGYPHDKQITDYLSALASTRVIWGGDHTIEEIQSSLTGVRCQDVVFSDRYSFSVIDAKSILESENFDNLVRGFYNDTYLYDQNACSSPRFIYWKGNKEEVFDAQEYFWNAVADYIKDRYELDAVVAIDKLTLGYRMAIEQKNVQIRKCMDNRIYRIVLEDLPDDLTDYVCPGGCFVEYVSDNLDDLTKVITNKYQTMTYFGFDQEELVRWNIEHGLPGIDRIVPIGKATEFNLIWDGYNLIDSLSRIIYCE